MIVRWVKGGLACCFLGMRETESKILRPLTQADIDKFMAEFKHSPDGKTVFHIDRT